MGSEEGPGLPELSTPAWGRGAGVVGLCGGLGENLCLRNPRLT